MRWFQCIVCLKVVHKTSGRLYVVSELIVDELWCRMIWQTWTRQGPYATERELTLEATGLTVRARRSTGSRIASQA
jgi:hypothetical protein